MFNQCATTLTWTKLHLWGAEIISRGLAAAAGLQVLYPAVRRSHPHRSRCRCRVQTEGRMRVAPSWPPSSHPRLEVLLYARGPDPALQPPRLEEVLLYAREGRRRRRGRSCACGWPTCPPSAPDACPIDVWHGRGVVHCREARP